jgi:hypothetical protein
MRWLLAQVAQEEQGVLVLVRQGLRGIQLRSIRSQLQQAVLGALALAIQWPLLLPTAKVARMVEAMAVAEGARLWQAGA